jgi:hypothetical protein
MAAEEARPLKDQATVKSQQAAQWSQRAADLNGASVFANTQVSDLA